MYGLGATVGLMLPYSRMHEKEADRLGLIFMAFTAILWRNNCGNNKTFMLISIRVFFICLMALNAPDAFFSMTAMLPVIYLPFSNPFFDMAINTLFVLGCYIRPYLAFARLYLYIADYCKGYKKYQT